MLLHLHTRADGDGVVILSGSGEVSERPATAWLPEIGEAYAAKYAAAMEAYGMGLEAIAEKFHVVIEVVPTRLQAW
ncbi:hypothetical protein [Oryzobacter terrae]|uniref:hypothetical protein n=1 Tax=Oryzobacter terrae TaxID=1620385 RepID=UPI00366CFF99